MDKIVSLLPFIGSERDGFLLEISMSDESPDEIHGYSTPFQVADNGQHFSLIMKAGLKTKHSSHFLPLFLLVQRDHYPILPDGLHPITNADIDKIWFDTIRSFGADKSAFFAPDHTWFRPLFFCKKKTKFFHPPCPECGGLLDLCTDDRLLKSAALFSYHASLKRYLYCPNCHASGGKIIFYQYSRSSEDRVFAKDRFDLIRNFNRLRSTVSGDFPCTLCPDHAGCYITGEKAASCISFFSFYPFHMLVFDAAAIKAVDFIPLLSGACFEDIPALSHSVSGAAFKKHLVSQGGPGFFFENENRFFLEVLYLKLSFIEKFANILKQKAHNNISAVVKLSAHSIWLTPQSQGSMLPFFWEFNLSIIDLLTNHPENSQEPFLAGDKNLNFIACLWFYTFVVNQNQKSNAVYGAVRQLAASTSLEDSFSDYPRLVQEFPCLALENIFWHPRAVSAPEEWHRFWLKTLFTGAVFLQDQHSWNLKTGIDALLQQIFDLKTLVKTQLFDTREIDVPLTVPESRAKKHEAPPRPRMYKQAVRSFLLQLKDKWEAQETAGGEMLEEDVLETIVLSSSVKTIPGSDAGPEDGFDTLEKTVVMTPDGITSSGETPGQDAGFFGQDNDLDKTVVIPSKK